MNRAKKKRNFVLLEILIAFALVGGAILPFLHYPFDHMRKEIDLLFEMELEKIAQKELIDWQIRLYKNEIDPAWIFGDVKITRQLNEDEVKVELCKRWNRTYKRKVSITNSAQKLTNDRMLTVLVHIETKFYPLKKREAALTAKTELIAQKKI